MSRPTPHVALVAFTGFRIREPEMLALGMTLPGLAQRAPAVGALPALGLLTLAALTPPPWTQSYHEAAAVDDEVLEAILATKPTLVAISALTASINEAYLLCRRLRAEGVRTVIGGLHATAMPSEASLHADAVVVGEGEPVWERVLMDAQRGELAGRYQASAPFDLGVAPLPRFELLGDRPRQRFTVQTARGCPLACEFCGASRLLGPFREKPAAMVERELAAIKATAKRPFIELADDNTFAGKRDAQELLGVLERSGVRFFTEADWRLGEKPNVLAGLARAGCVQVLVGIESLVPRFAGMGAKQAPPERIMEALANIQDAGVAVIGCFVLGADGEDAESLGRLGEFLLEAPLADVQLTVQTPFPGTAAYKRLSAENRLLPDRGWESYTLFDVVYRPDPMSAEDLERGFHSLAKLVFAAGPTSVRNARRQAIWNRRAG